MDSVLESDSLGAPLVKAVYLEILESSLLAMLVIYVLKGELDCFSRTTSAWGLVGHLDLT